MFGTHAREMPAHRGSRPAARHGLPKNAATSPSDSSLWAGLNSMRMGGSLCIKIVPGQTRSPPGGASMARARASSGLRQVDGVRFHGRWFSARAVHLGLTRQFILCDAHTTSCR